MALRAWAEADASALVRACSDPLTRRYTSVPAPYTLEDARLFIRAGRSATTLPLAVVDRAAPETLLGAVGLHAIDEHRGRAEIGYWTAPWARRRGVAARALGLLSAWALGPAGIARLELFAEPENVVSQRVALACGFARADLVAGGIALRGRRHDVIRFWREQESAPHL